MKFFILILVTCALYVGVNYMSLSETAVERWGKTTQFPDLESAELFCSMITPKTQAEFTQSINGRNAQVVASNGDELCAYWKQRVINDATYRNTRLNIKVNNAERISKFPYNKAYSQLNVSAYSFIGRTRSLPRSNHIEKYYVRINVNRKIEFTFERTLLGDYRIISLKGHDDIELPEEKRRQTRSTP